MSPAELLPALEAAGVRLVLTGPDSMEAEIPDPTPAGVPELLDEVRRHRGEVLALLAHPKVIPFDPARYAARRARTVARLQGSPCPSCASPGGWVVNARGDAWCRPCEARRRTEGGPP